MKLRRRFGLSAEQKIDVWRRWKEGQTLHAPECFPQGEVTLDITVGKLFFLFELRERQSANQEIVHA